jgi:acetyl-CoA C-acetyltransferase
MSFAFTASKFALTFISSSQDIVIARAARTPIGSFQGSLATATAPALGTAVIKHLIDGLPTDAVNEVYMGNVLSTGMGQAPARQATLGAGLPYSVPCTTINKVCASGMKAVMMAAQNISTGQAGAMIAGGMESMSNVPYYMPGARNGHRLGHGQVMDTIVADGLWDVYNNFHMGNCGEDIAQKMGYSREDQDAFAVESYQRAQKAQSAGIFEAEIVPVTVQVKRKEVIVSQDEECNRMDTSKIAGLKPAFSKTGTITAANASSINDGAAAVLVTTRAQCEAWGLKPMARILSFADAAKMPIEFTTAPTPAVQLAVSRAGLTLSDIHLHEINEAFAAVAMANMELLGIKHENLNIHGGAVGIGHPIGASGARIMVALLNALTVRDATLGCASICNGGGGASAIVLERL